MKAQVRLAIVLLVATILGCGDSNVVKSETRAVGAAEALKADQKAIASRFAEQKGAADEAFQKQRTAEERQRKVALLAALVARWDAALVEAYATPRSDFAPLVKKLQALVADAESAEVDDCTGNARGKLTASMAITMESFDIFQKSTGDVSPAATQKAQEGVTALGAANAAINACRGA